jgi:hypothetical protein
MGEILGETEGLVTESSLSSGEYINDLVMPTLSDFGSNLNVNLEGDYTLLVEVFKKFSEMFPETELLNALEIELRLNKLGDDMVRIGFSEGDINIQIGKEKSRLKELLKMGESIEAYYYKGEHGKGNDKKVDVTDKEVETDADEPKSEDSNKKDATTGTKKENATTDAKESVKLDKKEDSDSDLKEVEGKKTEDRRLEEVESDKSPMKEDGDIGADDAKAKKQISEKRSFARDLSYDTEGVGHVPKHRESAFESKQTQVSKYEETLSKAKVTKGSWRRLTEVRTKHKALAKGRKLQSSSSSAAAANDLELLLETRLAWMADWLESQWEEGHWKKYEFHSRWIGSGKQRDDKFRYQIISIFRCLIDRQLHQKKVNPGGNRQRNWYRRNWRIAGGWVGICRCPDGQRVWVGDSYNACRGIRCYGGTMERCYRGKWNSGSHYVMSCASGGQRAPCYWKRRYNLYHDRKCLEVDWSDPDPATSLEDVTTNDMTNGNKYSANRRRVNFSILNYLFKEIKYPVSEKDFLKDVVRPIEQLRNLVANGDLELEIFSNPKYNRYFKYLGETVNYARANVHNTRVLADADNGSSPLGINEISIKRKMNKESLNTGDGQFDLDLKEIGDMQNEITRRLSKLMAIRQKRRKLSLKVRYEVKPTITYELTKDMTNGGFDKINLDLIKIDKKNPYHEIARSFAMLNKLKKMESAQEDFISAAGLVRFVVWGLVGAVVCVMVN